MKTYLIEDDPLKAEKLKGFVLDKYSLTLQIFGSYQSGLKAIQRETPALVLMDMTLPTFDRAARTREGRSRPLGGYDVMRKMKLREIESKVIVVTQLDNFGDGDDLVTFDEITSTCFREFPGFFLGSVHFQQNAVQWQTSLSSLIDILQNAKDTPR